MNYLKYFLGLVILTLFSGCYTPTQIAKQDLYPKFYKQHPNSILVLPALNLTTSANASEEYRYTITKELTERGYYVFPVHLVDNFLKSENLPDVTLLREIPIKKLKEIFGADAILYVDIFSWDTNYAVLQSSVDVALNFTLINAHTEEEIWQSNGFGHSTVGASGNNGVLGLIVDMIAVASNTSTDYTEVALYANKAAFNNLPLGKYQKKFEQDSNSFIMTKTLFPTSFAIKDNELFVNNKFMKNDLIGFSKIEKGKITVIKIPQFSQGVSLYDFSLTYHSDFEDYYYIHKEKGNIYKRHRFFVYENGKPYLLVKNKKVFIKTNSDGTLKYKYNSSYEVGEEKVDPITGVKYFINESIVYTNASFEIDRIIELKIK